MAVNVVSMSALFTLNLFRTAYYHLGSIINVGVHEIELQHFSLNLDKDIEHNVKIL